MSRPAHTLVAILLCFGAGMALPLEADARVVINEIFYHAPEGQDELEFVELHNASDDEVDLAGWKFSKGLKFTFAPGARIEAGGFAVLCRNEALFRRHFQSSQVAGTFDSKLSNHGERLELMDARGRIVDTVKYQDSAPWPLGADGFSASLERICPDSGGDNFVNWMASPWSADRRTPAGTPGRTNASYSEVLPPVIARIRSIPETPAAGQPFTIEASVRDAEGVGDVQLLYRRTGSGTEPPEVAVKMEEADDGIYRAAVAAQTGDSLIRIRLRATGTGGARRTFPAETEPRPTLPVFIRAATNSGSVIPIASLLKIGSGTGSAFVHSDPVSGRVEVQDYVEIERRKNGFELHFAKGEGFRQAGVVHLLARRHDRASMAEWLAYEVHRRAGVATPLCHPVRLRSDDRPEIWHLLVEQPGRGFLRRQQLDDQGNLFKYDGNGRDAIARHAKRTNEKDGSGDLVRLLAGLDTNDLSARWEFIRHNFDVAQVVYYFSANTLVASASGFSEHYVAYHDAKGTGRWTLYPWGMDESWGQGGQGSAEQNLTLPYGPSVSSGDRATRQDSAPARFARPLLTTPQFRKLYLARVRELLETVFTEEKLGPVVAQLGAGLEPEVRSRAALRREDPDQAANSLRDDLNSFRSFVKIRRESLLAQNEIRSAGKFSTEGLEKPGSRKAPPAAAGQSIHPPQPAAPIRPTPAKVPPP